ncbi:MULTISPECIES: hypothetical protein [Flavobacteriaceae]|uniref:hypothetical protein n=1 Tax=Flavobacteriaceae TaxID=49546 RepID=UPI0014923BDD|nr:MULTISPECIES: hypothetical protein [Allomuricauda]MDC6366823.1 hypothetical protein [Muricauda sp. AC10]
MRQLALICCIGSLLYGCTPKTGSSVLSKTKPIFEEDFEAAHLKEMGKHWEELKNLGGMSFSTDVPPESKGKQSLKITYIPGKDNGGHLFKSFPEGYERLYARFYVKFLTRNTRVHHLVKLGGYNPAVPYPLGKAGLKPDGTDFFISGIEMPSHTKWDWGFYTYWPHMVGKPKNYWGNVFFPETPKIAEPNKWICVEFMIKLNDPVDGHNGEQAFWINGEKILHLGEGFPEVDQKGGWKREQTGAPPFEGFQWRTDSRLKLTFFWLNYYMTTGKPGEIEEILFDEVVVSDRYIGPL